MHYRLVIWDADNNREIPFDIPIHEENTVVEAGAGWLRRFPNDIVMIEEVEGG